MIYNSFFIDFYMKIHNYIQKDLYLMRKKAFNHIRKDAIESFFHIM